MAALTPGLIAYDDGVEDDKPQISATYQVELDAMPATIAEGSALARAAVAALGTPDGYYMFRLKGATINRNPIRYQVEVGFKVAEWPAGEPNPLLRPSTLNSSYDEWTESYFTDSVGTKALNTAFDRIDPLPQKKNGNLVLQITKNFSTFPAVAYDAIKFTRNDDSITIKGTTYATKTLLFLPATVAEIYEQVGDTTYHYFATTFRLAADHGLHEFDFESRGFRELGSDGKSQPILDTRGIPVTSPWPLDADGHALAIDADPVVVTLKPYSVVDWGLDFD